MHANTHQEKKLIGKFHSSNDIMEVVMDEVFEWNHIKFYLQEDRFGMFCEI